MNRFKWFLTAIILGLLSSASARAADIVSPVTPTLVEIKTESGWTFAISPYLWAAGLSGDVAQFGLPTTVHISPDFGDILKNLKFAAMVVGEARNDRFSLFGDIIYTKVSVDSGTPRGIIADGAEITAETFAGLFGAGYSIVRADAGYLDIVASARIWSVNTEISLKGGLFDGASVTDGRTWVDGLVGFRGKYNLTGSFYLTGWGLVGGGGAKLDWDVAAALGYQINNRISAIAGYRALGVNYRTGGFVFDAVQQGPIIGLIARF